MDNMIILLALGVMMCSIVCVMLALLKNGSALEKTVYLVFCQLYILSVALIQINNAAGSIVGQVVGFMLLVLGIAPMILKKTSFQAARYCIALGALLAAMAMFI